MKSDAMVSLRSSCCETACLRRMVRKAVEVFCGKSASDGVDAVVIAAQIDANADANGDIDAHDRYLSVAFLSHSNACMPP